MFKWYGGDSNTLIIGDNPLSVQYFYFESVYPIDEITVDDASKDYIFISEDSEGKFISTNFVNLTDVATNKERTVKFLHNGDEIGKLIWGDYYVNGIAVQVAPTGKPPIGDTNLAFKTTLFNGSTSLAMVISSNAMYTFYDDTTASQDSTPNASGAILFNIPIQNSAGSNIKHVSINSGYTGGIRETFSYYIQPDFKNVHILSGGSD